MSIKKAWKEFSYIKNDQWKDSQSSISESRSSRSYHFNKVKFNKSRQDAQQATKKFGLANIAKARGNSRQNSLVNSTILKRGESTSVQKLDRSTPMQSNLKSTKNRNIQLKMKRFVQDIRKIHDSLKQVTITLLSSFEKIKEQLEVNLINVVDHLLNIENSIKHHQTIHQIIHNSFLQIHRNIAVLPQSLSQLNNSREDSFILKNQGENHFQKRYENQIPSSPMLRATDSQMLLKSRTNIHSNFARRESCNTMNIDQFNLQLPITISQKIKSKPQTQRRSNPKLSSFRKEAEIQGFQDLSKFRNDEKSKSKIENNAEDKIYNLESIIYQMRSILNQ